MPDFKFVSNKYSDFKVDLDAHPVTGDLALNIDAAAVKNSVRNLLLVGKYERFYRPYVGAGLQKYLFEPITPVTAELIKESIIETISNFEPRAKLIKVTVTVTPDYNAYSATVLFGIVNLPGSYTVKQIIERIR